MQKKLALKATLDKAYSEFHSADFIHDDPIQIPHRFTEKRDIEIMAFLASILAWGQRKTIINSCNKLLNLFENKPYDFISSHSDEDLKKLIGFKHRTFNDTDLLYFVSFLKFHYNGAQSLEGAFTMKFKTNEEHVGPALICFHNYFTSLDFFPSRTRKHIATPERKSACKRLNMFLRWMVRTDSEGVDFGLWKQIKPSQLLCPLDVHVENQARTLGLIRRKQRDFQTVVELTRALKEFDPEDPVKYDFALFGLGIAEKIR